MRTILGALVLLALLPVQSRAAKGDYGLDATVSNVLRWEPEKADPTGKFGRFTVELTVTNKAAESRSLDPEQLQFTLRKAGENTGYGPGVLFNSRIENTSMIQPGKSIKVRIDFSVWTIIPSIDDPNELDIKLGNDVIVRRVLFKNSDEPLKVEDWEKEQRIPNLVKQKVSKEQKRLKEEQDQKGNKSAGGSTN